MKIENLTEFSVILPSKDNYGKSTKRARKSFEHEISELFGGFTVTECHGHWEGVSEPVREYRVAMKGDASRFFEIAQDYAFNRMGQKALYTKSPGGWVQIMRDE